MMRLNFLYKVIPSFRAQGARIVFCFSYIIPPPVFYSSVSCSLCPNSLFNHVVSQGFNCFKYESLLRHAGQG